MNGKRQTVWLVSMLSLMVVLSAYYLFTEDTGNLDITPASGQEDGEIFVDLNEEDSAGGEETNAGHDQHTTAQADSDSGQSVGELPVNGQSAGEQQSQQKAGQEDKDIAKTDAQILQEMVNQVQSGDAFFESEMMKRNEQFAKETEKLMKIITDSQENSDAASQAVAELKAIEEQQTKMIGLEEALGKNFRHVLVTKEINDKWKVIVQSDKLEKSEAVSIIDQAIAALGIHPGSISVQYVP